MRSALAVAVACERVGVCTKRLSVAPQPQWLAEPPSVVPIRSEVRRKDPQRHGCAHAHENATIAIPFLARADRGPHGVRYGQQRQDEVVSCLVQAAGHIALHAVAAPDGEVGDEKRFGRHLVALVEPHGVESRQHAVVIAHGPPRVPLLAPGLLDTHPMCHAPFTQRLRAVGSIIGVPVLMQLALRVAEVAVVEGVVDHVLVGHVDFEVFADALLDAPLQRVQKLLGRRPAEGEEARVDEARLGRRHVGCEDPAGESVPVGAPVQRPLVAGPVKLRILGEIALDERERIDHERVRVEEDDLLGHAALVRPAVEEVQLHPRMQHARAQVRHPHQVAQPVRIDIVEDCRLRSDDVPDDLLLRSRELTVRNHGASDEEVAAVVVRPVDALDRVQKRHVPW